MTTKPKKIAKPAKTVKAVSTPKTKIKVKAPQPVAKKRTVKSQGGSQGEAEKVASRGSQEVKKKSKAVKGREIKERKLIKGIVEGKTQAQAAKEAGFNPVYATEILKKPEVIASLQELMEHVGLDNGSLLVKHRELLNAQKQISGIGDANGKSVEFIEVPDYPTQMKALETAYKLKGAFVDKKEITGPNEVNVFNNIQINLVRP